MKAFDVTRMSLQALRRYPLRTAMLLLAIAIGVAAVVAGFVGWALDATAVGRGSASDGEHVRMPLAPWRVRDLGDDGFHTLARFVKAVIKTDGIHRKAEVSKARQQPDRAERPRSGALLNQIPHAFIQRQSGFLVSNVIPGGGAFAVGTQYAILARYGVSATEASSGSAQQMVTAIPSLVPATRGLPIATDAIFPPALSYM